jgi:hypothetical protein
VANPLQDQFAEVLLDRIRSDRYPSGTQMDIFEAVASRRMLLEYVLHLMDRIEEDPHPSIPMMHRAVRVIGEFGS